MSFKTELEWFDPKINLPDDVDRVVIFLTKHGGYVIGEYLPEDKRFGFFLEHYHLSEMKYWAYLTTLPEVDMMSHEIKLIEAFLDYAFVQEMTLPNGWYKTSFLFELENQKIKSFCDKSYIFVAEKIKESECE